MSGKIIKTNLAIISSKLLQGRFEKANLGG